MYILPEFLWASQWVGLPIKKQKTNTRTKTVSRPITEVKQRRAQSVLRWVTAWEYWVP